jgi:hypothetical protein
MTEVASVRRCVRVPRPWAAAVVVVLGLLAGGLAAAPVAAQGPPSLTVAPSSGLTHGQFATVTGTGFLPNTWVVVLMCPPGITNGWDCDLSWYTSAFSDADGSITTSVLIRRFITGNVAGTPTEFDCAVDTCTVAAGDVDQIRTAFAPVDLTDLPPPAPQLSTDPAGDNGVVAVSGSGFRPGRTYDLRQCPPGALELTSCDLLIQRILTEDDGNVGAEIYPRADALSVDGGVPTLHDCRVETCTLHVVDVDTTVVAAPLDLSTLPAPATTLTAEPVAGLTDSAAVELTGSGYAWGSGGPQLRQCGVLDAAIACPVYNQFGGIPESEGTVAFSAVVRRDAFVVLGAAAPAFVDCVIDACFLLSEELVPGTAVETRRIFPLAFTPSPHPPVDPALTVTRAGGDSYELEGTGFPLGGQFSAYVCGVAPGDFCTGLPQLVVPDGAGTFSVETTIPRFPDGVTGPDCLRGCVVRLYLHSLTFATSETFTSPAATLTVTIDAGGTLDPGTEDVVVWATITCDQPTQVQVEGTVSQAGVAGGYAFSDSCSPDEPLLAFIPTRDVPPHTEDFVLGPAAVTVSARPVEGAGSTTVTATATVTLLDEDAVVQAVGAALLDPANVELRALFLRSVSARLRQDPVFALELFRAIFGGG